MADRLYLHIGAPKTGTSYLQKMLWANKASLRDQGVFMPPGSRRKQFDAVADMRGEMWATDRLTASWDLLAERVRTRPGTALVSEELLCATPREKIEQLVESVAPVPVHVIFAARDVGRQAPAEWQQALRSRSAMTYAEWLQLLRDDPERSFWNVQDPVKVFSRWGGAIAPGNFHLLVVPSPGAPARTLWEHFARVIGVDPERAQAPESRQNESLGLVEAELLRRFNARLGDRFPLRDPYVRVVRDHLMRPALFGAPAARRIGVPDEYHEWLVARSEEMVRAVRDLATEVDVVGDPGDLAAHIERATASPEDLTEGELLEAALDSMVRHMEHVEAAQSASASRQGNETGAGRDQAAVHVEAPAAPWWRRLLRGGAPRG